MVNRRERGFEEMAGYLSDSDDFRGKIVIFQEKLWTIINQMERGLIG